MENNSIVYVNQVQPKIVFMLIIPQALLADTKTNRDKTADPISQLAMSDDKHRTRIFILVSKTMTDSELTLEFSQFGKVDHVQILKDKTTMENKVTDLNRKYNFVLQSRLSVLYCNPELVVCIVLLLFD